MTCTSYEMFSSSWLESRATGYLPLLVLALDPWPDLDFFQPNFAPIFFHPPSFRKFLGLVPGDMLMNPVSDVGGVVGGVIGSSAEPDGELALSSVRPPSRVSDPEDAAE